MSTAPVQWFTGSRERSRRSAPFVPPVTDHVVRSTTTFDGRAISFVFEEGTGRRWMVYDVLGLTPAVKPSEPRNLSFSHSSSSSKMGLLFASKVRLLSTPSQPSSTKPLPSSSTPLTRKRYSTCKAGVAPLGRLYLASKVEGDPGGPSLTNCSGFA